MEKLLYPGGPRRTLVQFHCLLSITHVTEACAHMMHTQLHIYIHVCMHLQACMQVHIQAHMNTCTVAHINTHKHVCMHPHMHTCRHAQTHAHAYVHTLSPRARAAPDSLEDPPLHHLGWTSDPSSFSISSAEPPPDGCQMPVCTVCVCVCVCVPLRRISRCLRQQGKEDHQSCTGFTSSPQAGSRHTVAGGRERLECLKKSSATWDSGSWIEFILKCSDPAAGFSCTHSLLETQPCAWHWGKRDDYKT